ncbi:MAG: hypothetical protein ACYDHH_29635 [Solirubrobacteraceae bacterium]
MPKWLSLDFDALAVDKFSVVAHLDLVELDARIALAISLALPRPKHERTIEEWREYYEAYRAELDELRRQAANAELVITDQWEVARAVAELAEVNDPRRTETVELLVELVMMIQRSGMLGNYVVYRVGGLFDLGWPSVPEENFEAHMTAAIDLGLFDPPDQPRREWVDPDADWEYPPNTAATLSSKFTHLTPTVNHVGGAGSDQPRRQPPPPTLRERFLTEWENLLGGIADRIIEELIGNDHIDYDGQGWRIGMTSPSGVGPSRPCFGVLAGRSRAGTTRGPQQSASRVYADSQQPGSPRRRRPAGMRLAHCGCSRCQLVRPAK